AGRQRMDPLTAFGLFAVSAMLVCYAMEQRSPGWILGFAAACALGSAYGFLQGAWAFGLVEAIWSAVAVRRWWVACRGRGTHGQAPARELGDTGRTQLFSRRASIGSSAEPMKWNDELGTISKTSARSHQSKLS